MNEDDYWQDALKRLIHGYTNDRSYSWSSGPDYATNQWIYDILKSKTEPDVSYSRYDRYNLTRGDEVATAVLDAYANGVEFETLIKKNSTVRQYWYQIQSEKAARLKAMERDRARREKAAEARAIKAAAKKEAMTKLTKEELEAFGLINKKRTSKA